MVTVVDVSALGVTITLSWSGVDVLFILQYETWPRHDVFCLCWPRSDHWPSEVAGDVKKTPEAVLVCLVSSSYKHEYPPPPAIHAEGLSSATSNQSNQTWDVVDCKHITDSQSGSALPSSSALGRTRIELMAKSGKCKRLWQYPWHLALV